MSQDDIKILVASFGLLSTRDLKQNTRFGHNSIAYSLHVLQHTNEIRNLPGNRGRPNSVWVGA